MHDLKSLKTTPKRIEILNQMGIESLEDILHHFPYKYEIIETTYPQQQDDPIIIEAKVISPTKIFFKGRFSRMTFEVIDAYENHYQVTIFNRHFLRQHLTLNQIITIIGKCKNRQIVATDIKIKPISEIAGIHPQYSLKEGISQKSFQGYVKKAFLILKGQIETIVPEEYIMKYQLLHKETALYALHFPTSQKDIKQALKYLKYEEFLQFQLTMQLIKKERSFDIGIKKDIPLDQLQEFILSLPFQLTKDQQQAVKDIVEDLKSQKMMYRFLQGDVGSGKTVVSAIALYANVLAHYQGALMAPTEILAKQHYETLKSFFKNTSLKMGLLTGSLTLKQKKEIYEKIENGEIDIIVGTHALFQKQVTYKQLGLVITDEQHRFGVEQRKALKNKGHQVDFLIMSATPIPRTLALSLFGDMDVTTIKTMPQGRIPIISKYIQSSSMKPILTHLKEYLSDGGQCYVICPLVEESESIQAKSASQIALAMQKYFKEQYQVGLLHGQMKDEEKEKVMQDFLEKRIQILVSTTVVEVGVDVKNANMMVIYNAERFGLNQLHQLRGRIGRSNKQAYCYFMSDQKTKEVKQRLEYMEKNLDGFEISKFDLQLRGPGEVLGHKQSGLPTFLVADVFKDFPILQIARDDASFIIEKYYKENQYNHLINQIQEKLKENNEYVD